MNQPGHATIVNAIIDKNRETIMANFQHDNIGAFGFGRPPPLDTSDPTHPLYGMVPPFTNTFEPNNPFQMSGVLQQLPNPNIPDPNIPSTQLDASIPQPIQSTTMQSIIHSTS
jgi:hypothetical protein